MPLILEGIVTTTNPDGSVNVAPMGPIVDRDISRLTLRPYRTSTTYANLKRTGGGVLNVTDDVELLARAAIDRFEVPPPMTPCELAPGAILCDACHWHAFRVETLDDHEDRTTIECRVVGAGELRPFFGFNRAKHAVLEAAILATRIGILPDEEIRNAVQRLTVLVDKTAGDQELRAWALLVLHIAERLSP